jgi:hypothetical protein
MAKLIERIELALQEGELDEKVNWRRSLATLLAGLGMAAAAPMAHGSGSDAQWDQSLNQAWQELSPKQQQELRQEERCWIKWRDSLPIDQQRFAVVSRVFYLSQFSRDPETAASAKDSIQAMKRAGTWAMDPSFERDAPEPLSTPTPTPTGGQAQTLEPFRLPTPAKGLEGGRTDVYGQSGVLPSGAPVRSSLQDRTISPDLQSAIWVVRERFNISKMSDKEIVADPKLHAEVQKELDHMDQQRKDEEASKQQREQRFRDWVTKAKANDPGNVEEDFKSGYRWGRFSFHGRTSTSGGTPGPVQQGELRAFYNTALFAAHNQGQEITSLSSFQKGFEQAVDDMWGIAPF